MTTPRLPLAAPVLGRPVVAPRPALRSPALRSPGLLTAALVLGCVAAAAATAVLYANAGARVAAADPDLARLLRAMAAVKALLLALAVGALGWRVRRPVAPRFLTAYLLLPWLAAAALGAMWQLTVLGLAAAALHGAGALLLLAAWRDPDFLPLTTASAPPPASSAAATRRGA